MGVQLLKNSNLNHFSANETNFWWKLLLLGQFLLQIIAGCIFIADLEGNCTESYEKCISQLPIRKMYLWLHATRRSSGSLGCNSLEATFESEHDDQLQVS